MIIITIITIATIIITIIIIAIIIIIKITMARGIKEKVEAKSRGNKVFKSMSEERLLSSLNESESVKESENEFDDARIKKIFMNFRGGFSKTKIKEIRKDFYRRENKRIFPYQK